jgi:hypothetical protein
MQMYIFVPNYIILIVFVSIIFHLKSSLAKNYLMSPLLWYLIFAKTVCYSFRSNT